MNYSNGLPVSVKISYLLMSFALAVGLASCATRPSSVALLKPTVVEAACGECKFGLKGDDCDLAIRFDGHSYFVNGVNPDSLGNDHAANGICKTIRQARVTGEVKGGRFVATSFELLPAGTR